MRMRVDMRPKKMLHTKVEVKRSRGRPRTTRMDQIRKGIEMRWENWEITQENRKWENRDGWRFLCNKLYKRFKIDNK